MKEKILQTVNKNTIEKLCDLAMLLPPESDSEVERDIEKLTSLLSPLEALEDNGPQGPQIKQTAFREDITADISGGGAVLSTAPEVSDGYLCVPRTVE